MPSRRSVEREKLESGVSMKAETVFPCPAGHGKKMCKLEI